MTLQEFIPWYSRLETLLRTQQVRKAIPEPRPQPAECQAIAVEATSRAPAPADPLVRFPLSSDGGVRSPHVQVERQRCDSAAGSGQVRGAPASSGARHDRGKLEGRSGLSLQGPGEEAPTLNDSVHQKVLALTRW
jgi:hypothetical protein